MQNHSNVQISSVYTCSRCTAPFCTHRENKGVCFDYNGGSIHTNITVLDFTIQDPQAEKWRLDEKLGA